MKLNEIKLLEAYKEKINTLDEVKKYLNAHCKNALKSFSEPLVRGMTFSSNYLILRGEDGHRKSVNTTNYYTEILDEILPKEFPLRSKSIIVANFENFNHAHRYGNALYYIFPTDSTKIGICPDQDIFNTKITLGGRTEYIYKWNDIFEKEGINADSFDRIVSDLEYVKSMEGDDAPNFLQDMNDIADDLAEAYRKPFRLTTTANPTYNDGKEHECWIGGPCVAILWFDYEDLLKNTDWIEK